MFAERSSPLAAAGVPIGSVPTVTPSSPSALPRLPDLDFPPALNASSSGGMSRTGTEPRTQGLTWSYTTCRSSGPVGAAWGPVAGSVWAAVWGPVCPSNGLLFGFDRGLDDEPRIGRRACEHACGCCSGDQRRAVFGEPVQAGGDGPVQLVPGAFGQDRHERHHAGQYCRESGSVPAPGVEQREAAFGESVAVADSGAVPDASVDTGAEGGELSGVCGDPGGEPEVVAALAGDSSFGFGDEPPGPAGRPNAGCVPGSGGRSSSAGSMRTALRVPSMRSVMVHRGVARSWASRAHRRSGQGRGSVRLEAETWRVRHAVPRWTKDHSMLPEFHKVCEICASGRRSPTVTAGYWRRQ
jgi:hypothetical protein